MKISACWIAKNEAAVLERSIRSVIDLADELIVVDTGSGDNTVEIARSLGARVEYFEWIGDFAAARNHALSLASGDIIIFLDADEWFEPALNEDSRPKIDKMLVQTKFDTLCIHMDNMNMETGLVMSSGSLNRIFKNDPEVRFYGKIHENIRRNQHLGPSTCRVPVEFFRILHSGYSPDVMQKKTGRNIQILQEEVETAEGVDKYMRYFYLLRENLTEGHVEEAYGYLKYLYTYPSRVEDMIRMYGDGMMIYFYLALELASQLRDRFSRKDVYRRLIPMMQKSGKQYPGAPTIDLYYMCLFDFKSDVILSRIDGDMTEADRLERAQTGSLHSNYKAKHAKMLAFASAAAWIRGQKTRAFDYAVRSVRETEQLEVNALLVLLQCVKGQPLEEIVLFLNSVINIENKTILAILVDALLLEDYMDLFLYYLKKQVDAGSATKADFLYIMLLTGNQEESAVAAAQICDENTRRIHARHLLLVTACTGTRKVLDDNWAVLEEYRELLEAFLAGTRLREPNAIQVRAVLECYPRIAIAAGREAADRMLDVIGESRLPCYLTKLKFLVANQQYREAVELDRSGIDLHDVHVLVDLVRCYLYLGEDNTALNLLKGALERETITTDILDLVLVVADRKSGVSDEARKLYNRYIVVQDECIDLQDVINTRIVFSEYSKKQKRALSNMTVRQFNSLLEEDKSRLYTEHLKALLLKAAGTYMEEKEYPMAQDCYRRLLAVGYEEEECAARLAQIFRNLDNKVLCRYFEEQKVTA